MLNTIFSGLFDTDLTTVIGVGDFLLCLGTALLLGVIMAGSYMYRTRYTKSFVVTLALLPAVVCVVIMMVNGNIGTGLMGIYTSAYNGMIKGAGSEYIRIIAISRFLSKGNIPLFLSNTADSAAALYDNLF